MTFMVASLGIKCARNRHQMLENRGAGGGKYLRISEVREERALKQLPDQFHQQGNAVVKMARHTVVTLQIQYQLCLPWMSSPHKVWCLRMWGNDRLDRAERLKRDLPQLYLFLFAIARRPLKAEHCRAEIMFQI